MLPEGDRLCPRCGQLIPAGHTECPVCTAPQGFLWRLERETLVVVSLVLLFETPGAALVAYVWLHQHPRLWAVPGLVLLFAGLVLVVRGRDRDLPVEAID